MKRVVLCATALGALAAGCGGGGSSLTSGAPAPGGAGGAQFTIVIPARTQSATARQIKYISPSTKSVTIAINGSVSVQTVNVTPGSPGCTTVPAGTSCVVNVSAPSGNDTFTVTMYDGLNGAGTALGSASATGVVAPGQTFNFPLTLNAVVSSFAVTLGATPYVGYAQQIPVVIVAKDPDGNVISGAGNFAAPITLSNSDTSGITSLSTQSVAGPGTTVMLSYSGARPAAPITIGASATGIAATAITPLVFAPVDSRALNNGNVFTYVGSDSRLRVSTATPRPGTSPAPAPTPVLSTTVEAHAITAPVTFAGTSGLIKDHFTFTRTFAGATPQPTFVSDQYFQWLPGTGGSAQLAEIIEVDVNPLSVTIGGVSYPYTIYSTNTWTPGSVIDIAPQTNGATFNVPTAAAFTNSYTYPANFPVAPLNQYYASSYVYSGNADGSYVGTAIYTNAIKEVYTLLPDGSGTDKATYPDGSTDTITVATSGPSSLTYTEVTTGPSTTPGTQTYVIPNVVTGPLQSGTNTITMGVAIPAACNLASSFGSTANAITMVSASRDPLSWATYTGQETDYVIPGKGLVCVLSTFGTIFYNIYNGVVITTTQVDNEALQSQTLTGNARGIMSLSSGAHRFARHLQEARTAAFAERQLARFQR